MRSALQRISQYHYLPDSQADPMMWHIPHLVRVPPLVRVKVKEEVTNILYHVFRKFVGSDVIVV